MGFLQIHLELRSRVPATVASWAPLLEFLLCLPLSAPSAVFHFEHRVLRNCFLVFSQEFIVTPLILRDDCVNKDGSPRQNLNEALRAVTLFF